MKKYNLQELAEFWDVEGLLSIIEMDPESIEDQKLSMLIKKVQKDVEIINEILMNEFSRLQETNEDEDF
jgi:hypothetical protein